MHMPHAHMPMHATCPTCPHAHATRQVHRATYKGKPVAVKVQRAGLKELFDTDLKNLKVLVKLLDKFDPKSDGADRSCAPWHAHVHVPAPARPLHQPAAALTTSSTTRRL